LTRSHRARARVFLHVGARARCARARHLETDLHARDIDRGGIADAFYDSRTNLTWLADANANGLMTWGAATSWADALVVGRYTGWRLPLMTPVNGTNWVADLPVAMDGSTDNAFHNRQTETGHLFYETLGNKAFCAGRVRGAFVEPGATTWCGVRCAAVGCLQAGGTCPHGAPVDAWPSEGLWGVGCAECCNAQTCQAAAWQGPVFGSSDEGPTGFVLAESLTREPTPWKSTWPGKASTQRWDGAQAPRAHEHRPAREIARLG